MGKSVQYTSWMPPVHLLALKRLGHSVCFIHSLDAIRPTVSLGSVRSSTGTHGSHSLPWQRYLSFCKITHQLGKDDSIFNTFGAIHCSSLWQGQQCNQRKWSPQRNFSQKEQDPREHPSHRVKLSSQRFARSEIQTFGLFHSSYLFHVSVVINV